MFPMMLRRDRERWGIRPCRMAWLLGMTVREYRKLEAGERLPDFDTCDRIDPLWLAAIVCTYPCPSSTRELHGMENVMLSDHWVTWSPAKRWLVIVAVGTYRDALLRQFIARLSSRTWRTPTAGLGSRGLAAQRVRRHEVGRAVITREVHPDADISHRRPTIYRVEREQLDVGGNGATRTRAVRSGTRRIATTLNDTRLPSTIFVPGNLL
jgi:hypothetical protein